MAHTPGPWIVSGISGGLIYKSNYPDSATFVADCNSSITDDDMQKDNARLIASAPDLLAALKKAEDSLDHLWAAIGDRLLAKSPLALEYAQDVAQRVCRAREEANAAIVKAESRS